MPSHRPSDIEGWLFGMVKGLERRGPDGEGIWVDSPVGLGHRRLAIVDLGETGKQPMQSDDGRFTITFNGEIYNYKELKESLIAKGEQFKSTSDTEVLLKMFATEGEAMLAKVHGMFAFAIWDKQKSELFFARDRIGKKPFFYQDTVSGFSFASELQALLAYQKPEIDWQAIRLFLGLQYIPAPLTGFVGVRSLQPGECGTWKNGVLSVHSYREAPLPRFTGSFDEAVHEVRRLFNEAVRYRMIADVEVGCFLSGGMDSSAVAAQMAKLSSAPIKTFTMGFPDWSADERGEAQEFSKRISAEHFSFEAKPGDAVGLIDSMVDLYAAPYADSSALPSYLLSKETKKHVKAVMNGDGGDEFFGGYKRYGYFKKALSLRRLNKLPYFEIGSPKVKRLLRTIRALAGGDAAGYAELFVGSYFSESDLKALLNPEFSVKTQGSRADAFIAQQISTKGVEAALEFDRKSYLPDDLCVKMDRATMAHGLEARSPFLDQNLTRFVASLPVEFHFANEKQKAVLQAAISDLVPQDVLSRPKRGFQVPLDAWFRGELKSVFEARCLSATSKLSRVFRVEEVKCLFEEHQRGTDHGNRLWMLLALATWLEKYA